MVNQIMEESDITYIDSTQDTIILGDNLYWLERIPYRSIDCVITDPPYGIDFESNMQMYNNRTGECRKVKDYKKFTSVRNDSKLPIEWLDKLYKCMKMDSSLFIFCHWTKWNELVDIVNYVGYKIKNMIVINKSNQGMGDLEGSFAPKHELLMFCTKGRPKIIGKRLPDVWNCSIGIVGEKRLHPNQKRIDWIAPAIHASTIEGDIILDPFAGCGSVHLAAHKTKRKCISIEIDPTHFKMMEARLSHYINPLTVIK